MKKMLLALGMASMLLSASPAFAMYRNSFGSHVCNDMSFWDRTFVQSVTCAFTEDDPMIYWEGEWVY